MRIKIHILLLIASAAIQAQNAVYRIELSGWWSFTIGDDKAWAAPDYDDSEWARVRVPANWEDQGFYGYDGYGWYRKQFIMKGRPGHSASLVLHLGYIDDADEVYFNGHYIGGRGSFPPYFKTAYNIIRKYAVPSDYINQNGINTIAVRVYDSKLQGGCLGGDYFAEVYEYFAEPEISLDGTWHFKDEDRIEYHKADYDHSDWDTITVPGFWESLGYPDKDGTVWYRKEFFLPEEYNNEKMILMLGKVDDLDQAVINGRLVGQTGEWYSDMQGVSTYDEYSRSRVYYLPDDLLKPGEMNVIAVRVYDSWLDGGIYAGPIGLITQKSYIKAWNKFKEDIKFWK